LVVSTSGTDSDYVVKLIDVYPTDFPDPAVTAEGKRVLGPPAIRMGGYQQLLRGEPMRAKFRNSWEKPQAMQPNQPTGITSDMPDLHHTFRAGHRIMVQIQSSWFPLADLNPQTFVDIPNAKPSDFKKATERVYRSKDKPSRVEVMVMP
jgi:predicted acyl esterase